MVYFVYNRHKQCDSIVLIKPFNNDQCFLGIICDIMD